MNKLDKRARFQRFKQTRCTHIVQAEKLSNAFNATNEHY